MWGDSVGFAGSAVAYLLSEPCLSGNPLFRSESQLGREVEVGD